MIVDQSTQDFTSHEIEYANELRYWNRVIPGHFVTEAVTEVHYGTYQ